MGCNAHNHPSDCDCGWGGTWHGNFPPGGARWGRLGKIKTETPRRPKLDFNETSFEVEFEALTIPNASCPVCGDSVFFYQNSHGSRVFFDSLGPPWPKHWCTDNRAEGVRRPYVVYEGRYHYGRAVNSSDHGWMPYRFVRARSNGMSVVCDMQTEIEYVCNIPAITFDNIWRLFFLREISQTRTEFSSYKLEGDFSYLRSIDNLMMKMNRKDKPEWRIFHKWNKINSASIYF